MSLPDFEEKTLVKEGREQLVEVGGGVEGWEGWREGGEKEEEEDEEEEEGGDKGRKRWRKENEEEAQAEEEIEREEKEEREEGEENAKSRCKVGTHRLSYPTLLPHAPSLSPALQEWLIGLFRDDTRRAFSTNKAYVTLLHSFWEQCEKTLPPSLFTVSLALQSPSAWSMAARHSTRPGNLSAAERTTK